MTFNARRRHEITVTRISLVWEVVTMKVFWSWQSDTPGNTGRHLIRSALEAAISELKIAEEIEDAVRNELHLDSDRQGVPGSPDLARLILEKIDDSFVIVADVTTVGSLSSSDEERKTKKLINSNVAIELGYALRALGSEGVLMVMNEFYGNRNDLPFDLRAKAGPIIFSLSPDADTRLKSNAKAELKTRFKEALNLCIREHARVRDAAQNIESQVQAAKATSADWEQVGKRIGEACRFLRADSQREKDWPTEQWRIAGGGNEMCEALLKKAGTMLLKSPNVFAKLPEYVRQESDPLARWFLFLKHKGHHSAGNFYNYVDDQGREHFGGVLGSIPRLAYSSSVVCEECSADEL
jgi:hypothetical protein